MSLTCALCRYFVQIGVSVRGYCKRFPPSRATVDGGLAQWPVVQGDDGACGELVVIDGWEGEKP